MKGLSIWTILDKTISTILVVIISSWASNMSRSNSTVAVTRIGDSTYIYHQQGKHVLHRSSSLRKNANCKSKIAKTKASLKISDVENNLCFIH